MKKKYFYRAKVLILSILFPFLCTSCDLDVPTEEPEIGSELNNNLAVTQMYLAHWQGTEFSMFQSIWMQQLAGVRSGTTMERIDRYQFDPEFADNLWNFYYTYCLYGLEAIRGQASRADAPAFEGIAQTLKGYSLLMMTDAWGPIPYEEAHFYFGSAGLPAYDTQQDVLQHLLGELDQAVEHLETAMQSGGLKPGVSADRIFGGDLERWIRAANLVRIRVKLRLANHDGNYKKVVEALGNRPLLRGNEDNMLYAFDGAVPESTNPYYYFDTNVKHSRVGAHTAELLEGREDPRLPRFVRRNVQNEYVGSAPGEGLTTASYLGPGIAAANAPLVMGSYAEQQLIKAEVFWRTGQQEMADQAFTEGVRASLAFFNARDQEWEAAHAEIDGVGLEQIIEAKYLALFLQPEVWADFRRTGYPALEPYDQMEVPRKFLYPRNEITGNPQNVPEVGTIFDPVWWDNR